MVPAGCIKAEAIKLRFDYEEATNRTLISALAGVWPVEMVV
jgi:hypothetical protein